MLKYTKNYNEMPPSIAENARAIDLLDAILRRGVSADKAVDAVASILKAEANSLQSKASMWKNLNTKPH